MNRNRIMSYTIRDLSEAQKLQVNGGKVGGAHEVSLRTEWEDLSFPECALIAEIFSLKWRWPREMLEMNYQYISVGLKGLRARTFQVSRRPGTRRYFFEFTNNLRKLTFQMGQILGCTSVRYMNQEQNIQTTEELQPELAIDPTRFEHWKRNAESQQNLQLGILAGSVAAIVGAIVWAAITVLTGYQIGYMAVGIGFLVGYAVRYFGKGLTNIFSITGAVLALVGCLLGNLFSTCGFLSIQESIPFFDVFSNVMTQFDVMLELLKVTFSPMDLLFYGIAIYEGYKLSTRQITQTELQDITKQV